MRFYQNITLQEDLHGDLNIHIAVSDNYDELFTSGGDEVNIFELQKLKKDADLRDSTFAVDELKFNLNHAKAINEADENVIFFCLEARDQALKRYIAVFFDTTPNIDNSIFIGQLDKDITFDDLVWNNGVFEIDIKNISNYTFTASPISISMLRDCLFTKPVLNKDKTQILPIYGRLYDTDFAHFKPIFENRLSFRFDFSSRDFYPFDNIQSKDCCVSPLANLFDIINKYLELCETYINDLLGLNISFEFIESNLGFKSAPFKHYYPAENIFWQTSNSPTTINEFAAGEKDKKNAVDVKLTNNPAAGESSVWLHSKIISRWFTVKPDQEIYDTDAEKEFTFAAYDNMSELLFTLAKNFNCILRTKTFPNKVQYWFEPRLSFKNTAKVYPIGAISSKTDLSIAANTSQAKIYSRQNNLISSGDDDFIFDNYLNTEPTTKLKEFLTTKNANEDQKEIKYERVPLSVSNTIFRYGPPPGNKALLPMNIRVLREGTDYSFDSDYFLELPGVLKANYPPKNHENQVPDPLMTGIFLRVQCNEDDQINNHAMSGEYVYRPATNVMVNINGKDYDFETIEDYLNLVLENDDIIYTSELSLTIPFINGFATDETGANPTWKNLELFKQIELQHTAKRFEDNAWIIGSESKLYTVTSIELNIGTLETSIKLQSSSRYAFDNFQEDLNNLENKVAKIRGRYEERIEENTQIKTFPVVSNEYIRSGDAVSIINGQAIKTKSESTQGATVVGVSVAYGFGGLTNDLPVVTLGKLKSANFNFNPSDVGKKVYARTNSNNNLTKVMLTEKTGSEDLLIEIGKITAVDEVDVNPSQARFV